MDVVRIFDTTLRDGEQSPGFSMNTDEKIRMARQLAKLGVDTIEAGFPISSRGDLEAVQAVAREVRDVPIAALARAKKLDVDAAVEALKPAASSRLHIFLATSDLHLQVKLHMTREQALEAIGSMIRYGRQHVAEVEFSAEDAGRTDLAYLCEACKVAVDAGATILNLPDTVGYAVPEEYGEMFRRVREFLGDRQGITLSAHCHGPRCAPACARSNVPSTELANALATPRLKKSPWRWRFAKTASASPLTSSSISFSQQAGCLPKLQEQWSLQTKQLSAPMHSRMKPASIRTASSRIR